MSQELELYKKLHVPIPVIHPDVRYQQLCQRRPGIALYTRHCAQTGDSMLSIYPEESSFPVVSTDAYTAMMYA